MKLICSYCHRIINEVDTGEPDRVSHGMCEGCFRDFSFRWRSQPLGRYLDGFDMPVLIVDGTCRIIAANQEMADMIGRPEREIKGLLGGEGMECVYSRREEGCGKDVHCSTCAIRNSITHTARTGETLNRVECYVEGEAGKETYQISTVKVGRSIQVVFEPAPGKKVGES